MVQFTRDTAMVARVDNKGERHLEGFGNFERVEIVQKQLVAEELPDALKWTLRYSEPLLGWNLIVKAAKRS